VFWAACRAVPQPHFDHADSASAVRYRCAVTCAMPSSPATSAADKGRGCGLQLVGIQPGSRRRLPLRRQCPVLLVHCPESPVHLLLAETTVVVTQTPVTRVADQTFGQLAGGDRFDQVVQLRPRELPS
jgi:hypothetical protein